MSKTRLDKKIPILESFFESILVCNEKKLRPFIEIFICEPENISQQKLGTILGIFEISDTSEDSSYIANYLISAIKKEYFSKLKRGSLESFEASLHKANLALSKLAEHGSINWIGKINALIVSIEKNGINISQAGNASALLLRSKGLTDISEGLAPDESEFSPLKTFANVSSGKLEENDKLIITTSNIFNIFSFEEIKRSALKFSKEEFARFLRTALNNELEKAGVLIIDIARKKELPELEKSHEPFNPFSQQAFSKNQKSKRTLEEELEETIKQEEKSRQAKEKIGHLYIKETESPPIEQPSSSKEFWDGFGEKAGDFFEFLWKQLKKLSRETWELIAKIRFIPWKTIGRKIGSGFSWLFSFFKSSEKKPASEEIQDESSSVYQDLPESLPHFRNESAIEKKSFSIIPNLSLLKRMLSVMSYRQKIYVTLAILAIIIIPYFIVKIEKSNNDKKAAELALQQQETIQEIIVPLTEDKNVSRLENLNENYSGENISKVLNLNDKIFAVSASEIINLENSEKFAIPSDFGSVDISCPMDDLNLILLLNKASKKIISWSPISKKFQTNNIVIPENAEISDAQTYLTYIYLIDSKNSQIYRYPRAEGGFGEKVDWKKDSTDISAAVSIAINENLFLVNGKDIFKFYRGKKQDFNIEKTATSIRPEKLWTKRDNTNLYVLDKENSRIIKLDANGSIISQFYNPEIANAINFTVNESSNNIFFTTSEKTKSFQMN